MTSYRTSKFDSERPGTSARVYEYENSNCDSFERRSKIPKMPKRTYSLEGRRSVSVTKRPNTKSKNSTTSMIPRPEWKKQIKKIPFDKQKSQEILSDASAQLTTQLAQQTPETGTEVAAPVTTAHCSPSVMSMENKVIRDLTNFKNSVVRVPEYWTDAGETVNSILKNVINIITKQYPTADVQSFETDIDSILKATDTVKQQILSRTENIITKANQIYAEKNERNPAMPDEDLKKITKKISDLKHEVYHRKNVFGDLLKYGSEMKELLELEKALKLKAIHKDGSMKDSLLETGRNDHELGGHSKHLDGKKCKKGMETVVIHSKKSDKHSLQSCGDIIRQETQCNITRASAEDKGTQTHTSWCEDLRTRERELKELNKQMMELHQLCKDHISKFKNFNLQIKMRGMCNKTQHAMQPKEICIRDDKMELLEKNNNLASYSKDLETAIKQKDLERHNKEKLIHQQKKLLHVRDELIGMLKNRCNVEEQRRY